MTESLLCHCCGKGLNEFETRLDFLKHLEIAEKCKKCDKYFVTKHDLNSHIKKVHGVRVKCDCCDKFFSNKANLKAHLKNKESEWKPVVPDGPKTCNKCHKLFKSGSSLRVHMSNTHRG